LLAARKIQMRLGAERKKARESPPVAQLDDGEKCRGAWKRGAKSLKRSRKARHEEREKHLAGRDRRTRHADAGEGHRGHECVLEPWGRMCARRNG
jgi:hypothetical protein